MNRISGFDISLIPNKPDANPAGSAPAGHMEAATQALLRRSLDRIAAIEPELSAVMVVAPLVIAVLAALPIFIAA